MRHVSYKSCRENQNILYSINFFEHCATYEIVWKNVVGPDNIITTVTNTFRIGKTYCLSMVIMVMPMNLIACLVQISSFSLNFYKISHLLF
jgi:hypothetical protein